MAETYKPKINAGWTALFLVFILFGLFGTYLARHETSIVNRYITLIFTVYGMMMLIRCFKTNYVMEDDVLQINAGFKPREITYENIIILERRKINPLFKYGAVSGIIRAETDINVLMITFLDNDTRRTIMISPKKMGAFVEAITKKCPDAAWNSN